MAKIGYFESMKRKKKIKDTIANIILAILVVLTLGPIVFMVLTSLMDHNAIARGKWIAPTRFSNYVEVFQKLPFGIYFRNSLIVCSIVMVVALVIATLAGYSLAKYKFPGSGFFGILILATQLLPGMMFLLPLYLDLYENVPSAIGIIFVSSAKTSSFVNGFLLQTTLDKPDDGNLSHLHQIPSPQRYNPDLSIPSAEYRK